MDTEISIAGGGVDLAGLLTMPSGGVDVPGVVLVGGSGPSTRHNDGFFVPVREHLGRAGIAVLSYDKRGVGGSEGRWESASVDDLAADAAAALALLRDQPRVDPVRVSLFGHSEGGWVVLRAALLAAPPALLVLNSCPAVSFIDSEVFAQQAAGASAGEAGRVRTWLDDLTTMADAGGSLEAARERCTAERGQPWFDRIADSGFDLDDATWSQLRVWGRYDPTADLSRCTVPTAALFGAADPLVPVPASVDAYRQTAIRAGRKQFDRVFPGAGHRMSVQHSAGLVPGYLECVMDLVVDGGSALVG